MERIPENSWPPNLLTMQSLWHYDGLARQLILQAKIQNQYALLSFMRNHVLQNFVWDSKTIPSCAFMSAPSSLWGRLRGRFDIAYWIAKGLSTHFDLPLYDPGQHQQWRLKKRAALAPKRPPKNLKFRHANFSLDNQAHIILIDDVVTTGWTCKHTVSRFPQFTFQVIALADSFRSDTYLRTGKKHRN